MLPPRFISDRTFLLSDQTFERPVCCVDPALIAEGRMSEETAEV